jgi:bacterioferritin (cytochrome b1)
MNSFEKDLMGESSIPLHEAAEFFCGIKKHAEWTDPPDMTGELEGLFNVPPEQIIDKLKSIIAMKWRKMIAYYTYAQCFRDHAWRAIKIEFAEHACDEHEDAEFYTKRAVALGGPVHIDVIDPPPASNNPFGILKMMARAEQEVIAAQRELLKMVGDENPMRVGIDNALSHDQHHLDEMWQIMTQEEHQSVDPAVTEAEMAAEGAPPEMGGEMPVDPAAELPVEDPAAAAPPEAEPPVEEPVEEPVEAAPPEDLEEKAASMRMQVFLQKTAAPLALPQTPALVEDGLRYVAGKGRERVGNAVKRVGDATGITAKGAREGLGFTSDVASVGALLGLGGMAATKGSDGAGAAAAKAGKGAVKTAAKEPPTDDELKETGRQRGVTSLAAEAEREKGRRGERAGKTVGGTGGMLAGGAAGRKLTAPGKGKLLGTALGALGGAVVGSNVGKQVGKEVDIAKNAGVSAEKIASMRLSLAMRKMAEGEMAEAEAPMASPTSGEMEPTNYLNAELAGRQAQEQNESAFYREQLGGMQAQSQQLQQQVADAQMQLEQVQQQAQEASAQIQASTQQAVAAQDAATQQTLEAAKSRIGAQEMRAKMMELASMDPQQLGEQALAPAAALGDASMGAPPGMAPPGMEGPPGGPPGAPPGPPPPAAGPPGGAPNPPLGAPPEAAGAPQGLPKLSSAQKWMERGIGAGVGAATGAGSSLIAGTQADSMAAKADELEAARDGSFRAAAKAISARQGALGAQLSKEHPYAAAGSAALGGALMGGLQGPMVIDRGRALAADTAGHLKAFRS